MPAHTEKSTTTTVETAAPPQTQAQTSQKASHKPHRKKRSKKARHKPAQAQSQGFYLNTPIVVEAVNSWGNEKRVVVRNPKSHELKHLRVGDNLGGWTIEDTQGKDVILQNSKGRALLKMPGKGGTQ